MDQSFRAWRGWITLLLSVIAGCSAPSSENDADRAATKQVPAAGERSSEPLKVVLVTNGTSAFWDTMAEGMRQAQLKLKVSATWVGPPSSEVNDQKKLVKDQAATANAIGISAVEAAPLAPVINELIDRGTPVVTFDSDVPRSKRLVYIGTDNFKAGQAAGREMVRLLPHGGNVFGFVGNVSAENARQRKIGFESALQGHNIHLVKVFEDQQDPKLASTNVSSLLDSQPQGVQGLVGFFSYNLPTIVQAVRAAGLRSKIKIVGFDADQETQDALQDGLADATIVQKPFLFGYLSVEYLYFAHRDGAERARLEWNLAEKDYPLTGDHIDTGVEVVTPSNIGAFRKRLKRWGVTVS